MKSNFRREYDAKVSRAEKLERIGKHRGHSIVFVRVIEWKSLVMLCGTCGEGPGNYLAVAEIDNREAMAEIENASSGPLRSIHASELFLPVPPGDLPS